METRKTEEAETPESKSNWPLQMFAATVGALLIACFCLWVLRNYFVKAYSDPMNWLVFARDLGSQFATTRFAVGYAAFLWLMLKTVGPFYVFLSNLPILVLLAVFMGLLARRAAEETEPRSPAILIGLAAIALLLRFDRDIFAYLTNPYRDLLAHVFLLASALLLLRYLKNAGKSRSALCLSAFLVGLAFSVREPSFFFAVPLFFVGLSYWHENRRINLLRSTIQFAVFFFLGCAPLLAQTYCITGQILVPAYSVQEGAIVPGLSLRAASLSDTFHKALNYYWGKGGPMYATAFVLGVLFALKRRNKVFLFLIMPAIAIYTLFYLLYWAFVARYFFIVTLLVMPVAAFGAYKLVEIPFLFVRRTKWAQAAFAVLTVALAAQVVWGFRPRNTDGRGLFRIPHARELKHDLETVIPAGSTVLCSRNMCEIIDYFTHAVSYPAHFLLEQDFCSDSNVLVRVNNWLKSDAPPFYMDVPWDWDRKAGYYLLRRYFDLEPITRLSTAKYNLSDVQGPGEMALYRIVNQSQTTARHELEIPGSDEIILRINAGMLRHSAVGREYARLYLNDALVDDRVEDGANYYAIRTHDFTPPYVLTLKSDGPVPSDIDPALISPQECLLMDMGIFSAIFHDSLLSPSIRNRPAPSMNVRTLRGKDSVRVPTPWSAGKTVFAEFRVRALPVKSTTAPVNFSIWRNGQCAGTFVVAREYDFQSVTVPVAQHKPTEYAVLDLLAGEAQADQSGALELDSITLFATPMKKLFIDIGEQTDTPFIVSGFYDRETDEKGRSLRWTAGEAAVRLYDWETSSDLKFTLTYWKSCRAVTAPPDDLKIMFNGRALETTEIPPAGGDNMTRVEAIVPASYVSDTSNMLELVSVPWAPRECVKGSKDKRLLGIFVESILMAPEERDRPRPQ